MGRSPAEIAEGAKDYWEGECSYIGAFFCNSPGLLKRIPPNPPPKKGMDHGQDLTHPHGQVDNATAPLRLCARLSGSGWGGMVGKAATFRTTPRVLAEFLA